MEVLLLIGWVSHLLLDLVIAHHRPCRQVVAAKTTATLGQKSPKGGKYGYGELSSSLWIQGKADSCP